LAVASHIAEGYVPSQPPEFCLGQIPRFGSCIVVSIVVSFSVANIADILSDMKRKPKGIRFQDRCKVCDHYFGEARQTGSSHRIYKTPWLGDPRVNIQNAKGMAKAYQVRQVIKAIERLEEEGHVKK
jgi:hypothetical protein